MRPQPYLAATLTISFLLCAGWSLAGAPRYIDMTDRKARLIRTMAADDAFDSRIRVELMLYSNDVPPESVSVWMVTPGDKLHLPVDSAGVIELGEHEASLEEMTGFELDPYEEGFGFGARMVPNLPLAVSIDPLAAHEAVQQFNAIIKREAGVLSVFAPGIKGIKARLAPGDSATLTTTSGRSKTIHADEVGFVEITWKFKSLQSIDFSSTPTGYDFAD